MRSLALLILAAAGSAAAQTPTVSIRIVASNLANSPHSLPNNQTFTSLHRQGPGLTLLESNLHNIYLADGSSFQPVMVAGTQVPGQAPGVVWASRLGPAQTYDITGRGQLFHANISSPNLGQNRTVALIGDLLNGDLWMGPVNTTRADITRTALYPRQGNNPTLDLGHVETGFETIIPAGAIVPGSPDPVTSWGNAITNADGGMTAYAFSAAGPINQFSIVNGVITPLIRGGFTFETDRGTITAAFTPNIDTQLLADGSVPMSGRVTFPDGITRQAAWIFRPGQTSQVIAVEGEHPPGTPQSCAVLFPFSRLATRGGTVLWFTTLQENGASAGEAFYLWSNGLSRLILRSRIPAPGNPTGQPVPTLDASTLSVLQLNERGDVAIQSPLGGDSYLYLYSPEAGTVEVARRTVALTQLPPPNVIAQITPFYGSASGAWRTAGDDTGTPLLDADGELFFAGGTSSGNAYNFGAFARISSPGCRADYTQDGFLDFFDYIAFLDCFEGGACAMGKDADFNNDGFPDFFDYSDFIDAFESGC